MYFYHIRISFELTIGLDRRATLTFLLISSQLCFFVFSRTTIEFDNNENDDNAILRNHIHWQ